MSNLTYCLLVGRVLDAKPFSQNPRRRLHYHLLIEAAGAQYDVAVNIASEDPAVSDTRVLYAVKENITPPNAPQLLALSESVQNLESDSPLRLDYVANGLVTRAEMTPLPLYDPHDPAGLNDQVMQAVQQAVAHVQATVYAFGHRYTARGPRNAAWQFSPDDGVHNIHMNQGNARGNHDDENGRHEDGALLIHFADTDDWSAIYIAFQTQSWTNDDTGYPVG